MHPLAKLIRARPGAKSRFHTERGDLMPLAAFAELPMLITTRLRGQYPEHPWMATPAVRELDNLIQPQWKVLEFGSGRSTAWYAARAASVLSLENDPQWHATVNTNLRNKGYNNVELRLVPLADFRREAADLDDNSFDLVIVDSIDGGDPDTTGRVGLVAESMSKLKTGGYLVLDNSDRTTYANADQHLAGWPVNRYVSVQVKPLTATETSIYLHP